MGLGQLPQIVFAADWLLELHLDQSANKPRPHKHAHQQGRERGKYRAEGHILKHPQR